MFSSFFSKSSKGFSTDEVTETPEERNYLLFKEDKNTYLSEVVVEAIEEEETRRINEALGELQALPPEMRLEIYARVGAMDEKDLLRLANSSSKIHQEIHGHSSFNVMLSRFQRHYIRKKIEDDINYTKTCYEPFFNCFPANWNKLSPRKQLLSEGGCLTISLGGSATTLLAVAGALSGAVVKTAVFASSSICLLGSLTTVFGVGIFAKRKLNRLTEELAHLPYDDDVTPTLSPTLPV